MVDKTYKVRSILIAVTVIGMHICVPIKRAELNTSAVAECGKPKKYFWLLLLRVTKVTAALCRILFFQPSVFACGKSSSFQRELFTPSVSCADSSLNEGAVKDSSLITLQIHSRIAFLGASALLLVSYSQHLTSSATGCVSVLCHRMTTFYCPSNFTAERSRPFPTM